MTDADAEQMSRWADADPDSDTVRKYCKKNVRNTLIEKRNPGFNRNTLFYEDEAGV